MTDSTVMVISIERRLNRMPLILLLARKIVEITEVFWSTASFLVCLEIVESYDIYLDSRTICGLFFCVARREFKP